ncbi:hypothetical protein [Bacteroides sp. Marseille-P3684]|uniref:hypothetical protein n=1 Tax=Bacteroides sp. Marseille-P3684 TaxID=2086579 RepID=UPI00130070F4|nr:hypothetical protein [Bacteroides sp. Marseille-P3684]
MKFKVKQSGVSVFLFRKSPKRINRVNILFEKKKIKDVLFTEKNICTLCESKEKRINVKISTRTYDKNGEGC